MATGGEIMTQIEEIPVEKNFDNAAPDYEKTRPAYVPQISEDRKTKSVGKDSAVSEIGMGVGTAEKPVSENILLYPDGVYRWVYEFDMLKNPTIMFTVWKVLGISFGVVFLFDLILTLFDSVLGPWEALLSAGKLFLILAGVFLVISVISYIILGALYGWKYQVLFEMTEKRVTHIQMPKQFRKAEAIGSLTALAGNRVHKPYMVALGSNVEAKDTTTSEFKRVKKVKACRRHNTIYVNQFPDKNQVYADDADFDFVLNYICEHVSETARIQK